MALVYYLVLTHQDTNQVFYFVAFTCLGFLIYFWHTQLDFSSHRTEWQASITLFVICLKQLILFQSPPPPREQEQPLLSTNNKSQKIVVAGEEEEEEEQQSVFLSKSFHWFLTFSFYFLSCVFGLFGSSDPNKYPAIGWLFCTLYLFLVYIVKRDVL